MVARQFKIGLPVNLVCLLKEILNAFSAVTVGKNLEMALQYEGACSQNEPVEIVRMVAPLVYSPSSAC